MSGLTHIYFFSLATAFVFVNLFLPMLPQIKLFKQKPLNCVLCMTGWFSLALSLSFGYEWWCLLIAVGGWFVGAMFESIQMRWL